MEYLRVCVAMTIEPGGDHLIYITLFDERSCRVQFSRVAVCLHGA